MNENDNPDSRRAERKRTDKMSKKEIDDNLEESFSSSDPPSWTVGSNHSSETEREAEEEKKRKD